jgi:hypothetical protein
VNFSFSCHMALFLAMVRQKAKTQGCLSMV